MLTTHRRPANGTAEALVIFVHGYGADGKDLLGIGDVLAEHLPGVAFVAPDAPDPCRNNPMGYQWFPVPWLDGSTEAEAMADMERAVGLLNAFLDEMAETEGVPPEKTILFGFSQGTMMSLHVGPRRPAALAGICGFSGRLLQPEKLDEAVSKLPILLVHGDADEIVPPASMPAAADALTKAGFPVYTHVSKGTAHGIAPDGLSLTLGFMRETLKITPPA